MRKLTRPQVLDQAFKALARGEAADLPPGSASWQEAATELLALCSRQRVGPGALAAVRRTANEGLRAAEGAT